MDPRLRSGGRLPARAYAWISCVLVLVAACVAAGSAGTAAAGTVSVTGSIQSSTALDIDTCLPGTAGVTDLGSVAANATVVSSGDCVVEFGSSNDSSTLRIVQRDGVGSAMYQPPWGALDSTWTGDGTGSVTVGSFTNMSDVARQPDGKLVAVGSITVGAGDKEVVVIRFNADGSLDPTFDGEPGMPTTYPGDGIVSYDLTGNDDTAEGIAVRADGRIITSSTSYNGGTATSFKDVGLLQLLPDGSHDPAFGGGDGIALQPIGPGADNVGSITIGANDRAFVALEVNNGTLRFGVAAFLPDGNLDTSFSNGDGDGRDGARITDINAAAPDTAHAVIELANGDIVVGGTGHVGTEDDVVIQRLTSNGLPRAGFGNASGYVTIDVPGSTNDEAYGLVEQDDGMIAWSGVATGGGWAVAVGRILPASGAADPTFNGGAPRMIDLTANNDQARTILQQPDGKLVLAIMRGTGAANGDLGVIRLNADGSDDTSFDGDGVMWSPDPATNDQTPRMVITQDGRYVLVGDDGGTKAVTAALQSLPVPDYSNGSTDFSSSGGAFGVCLHTVSGGAGGVWTPAGTGNCTAAQLANWHAVVPTTDTNSRVATATNTVNAIANLRFGFRAASNQRPGSYIAPVTFNVIAPAV